MPVKILGHHLIIGVTVLIGVGLSVTYTLSVATGHVEPLWCFISYTGNFPVESCIFSLVFNLSSAIYFFIVFLRYLQVFNVIVTLDFPEKKITRLHRLNLLSVVMGTGGAFGLSMTGCFQQGTFHLLHIIGVVMCTYLTLFFVILQTYFTYSLPPLAVSTLIRTLRASVLGVSSCILACGPFVTAYYFTERHSHFELFHSASKTGDDLGYKIGAALEWILFILNQLFICSFCPEFRKIALRKNEIVFV